MADTLLFIIAVLAFIAATGTAWVAGLARGHEQTDLITIGLTVTAALVIVGTICGGVAVFS